MEMAPIKIKYYKRRRTQTNHSAEKVASNDDLLTEILLRLPAKSLIQFKTISKHWLSLITSPHFTLLRYPIPPKSSGFFLQATPSNHRPEYDYITFGGELPCHPPFRALTFVLDFYGIRIIQSCNGLLFCCSTRWPERCRKYYVYNPTTKLYTTIPPLPGNIRKINIHSMVLAFDPSRSPHYKVICVRGSEQVNEDHDLYQIVIYSSETGPWRVSGQPFTADGINFRSGVYLDGAVHWTSNSDITRYFKIDEERLETMPMPQFTDGWNRHSTIYFGESRGHLHYVDKFSYCNTEFDVYEVEKNYSRWFVKYSVDLSELFCLFLGPSRIYLPWRNADFEILRIVRGEREDIQIQSCSEDIQEDL